MPSQTIVNYLSGDVNDRTPQAVITANPNYTFVGGASAIPQYLYLSLKTLWSQINSSYPLAIWAEKGDQKITAHGGINVTSQYIWESVLDPTDQLSWKSDDPGAESSTVYIKIFAPKVTGNANQMQLLKQMLWRVRYLLDVSLRDIAFRIDPVLGKPMPGQIPMQYLLMDPTIDASFPFVCEYVDTNQVPEGTEFQLVMRVNYKRLFLA